MAKRSLSLSDLRGVMTSSSPSTLKSAERPSTRTLLTASPSKSRLKRDSALVARASMVSAPTTVCERAAVG